ncbi:MAG: M20/M25/M40 family metallo-hydrolase, partial [Thermoplasmata archaeon]
MSGPSEEVRKEVTELLSDLIRIDTTNPPGNETPAAELVADKLSDEGLKPEILESEDGRGSVVARIEGRGGRLSLLLLSHLDVVVADPSRWSVHPFSGDVKDGFVWGRGALDMKGMVAIEVAVMSLLARRGVRPRGDVLFASVADEEKGGRAGAGWLVENHLEKVKADYVINEGGGFSIPVDGKHVFLVQTAEKGIMWMRIRARGSPGHASMPGIGDNAILRMASVIQHLGTHRTPIKVIPVVKLFIETLSEERGGRLAGKLVTSPLFVDRLLNSMSKDSKGVVEAIRAMLRTTMAPTMVRGGVKENVIPSECEAVVDCRILPGQSKKSLLEEVDKALEGIEKLEIDFLQESLPSESPFDT